MKTFHFETPFDEWKYLQNCWNTVKNHIRGDSNDGNNDKKLNDCVNALNNRLFDRNGNNNNSNRNDNKNKNNNNNNNEEDISIETMNNLLLEIDNEMKNDKVDNNHGDESSSQLDLSTLYPSKIVDFINLPVKCIFSSCVCLCLCLRYLFGTKKNGLNCSKIMT